MQPNEQVEQGQETTEELNLEEVEDLDAEAIASLGEEDLAKLLSEEEDPGAGEVDETGGEKGEGEPVEPSKKDGEVKIPELGELSEKLAKLEKQVGDKETFIQRQGNTIGELRRQLEEVVRMGQQEPVHSNDPDVAERDLEEFQRDPRGYLEKMRNRQEQATNLQRSVLQANVREAVPDIDELKDSIAKIAEEDGFPSEMIENFKATGIGSPYILKGYAARVKMANEFAALKKERDDLAQKLKDAPKAIIDKINAAAKKKASISGIPGDTGKKMAIPSEDHIHDLSDEELNRALERLQKEEHK